MQRSYDKSLNKYPLRHLAVKQFILLSEPEASNKRYSHLST